MKRNYIAIAAIVLCAAVLGGCAHTEDKGWVYGPDSNYFTDTVPTVDSLKTTQRNQQIYRKTLYVMSDFKADGQLKTLGDYDFSQQDAPCTVLGDAYHESPILKEAFYQVKVPNGDKPFVFQCRASGPGPGEHQYRLFLIGTTRDCDTRSWDWKRSVIPNLREYGYQCAGSYETRGNKKMREEYLKAFRPNVVKDV